MSDRSNENPILDPGGSIAEQLAAKDAEIERLRSTNVGLNRSIQRLKDAASLRQSEWEGRFRVIVGEDSPDAAGNVVISLKARADKAERERDEARRDADNHRLDNQRLSAELDALREGRIPAKYAWPTGRGTTSAKTRPPRRAY